MPLGHESTDKLMMVEFTLSQAMKVQGGVLLGVQLYTFLNLGPT